MARRDQKSSSLLLSCRLTLAILCFLILLNVMTTRINLSFALVCMVKTPGVDLYYQNTNETEHDLEENPESTGNSSNPEDFKLLGEFEWGKDVQSHLLGAYFYGYMMTQILGGWLSDRFGGKPNLLLGTLLNNILVVGTPTAARVSPKLLFAVRLLQGCAQGFTVPAIMVPFSRWTAPNERAFLLAIAYSGFTVANAIIFPLSGVLCQYGFAGGWPSIFYVTGLFGLLLCFLIWFMVYDSPEQHPRISESERIYLRNVSVLKGKDYNKKDHKVPWIAILKSVPVHAFVWTLFTYQWGFLTLQLNVPIFMKEALQLDINENGILSGVPFMGTLISHFLAGKLFDHLRGRNLCSLTRLRKIFNTIGFVIPGVSLIIVPFLTHHHKYGAVSVIAVGQIMSEFALMGGFYFCIIDVAPRLSGVLIGIGNSIALATGFLCPLAIAALTPNGTKEEWATVFYVAAGAYLLATTIFLVFGSSELQPWAEDSSVASKAEIENSSYAMAMLEENGQSEGKKEGLVGRKSHYRQGSS